MEKNQTIILGVSGGIAAVKVPALIQLLKQQKLEVKCVLTRGAKYFINLKGRDFKNSDHIKLAQSADLILIAPATANLMAKLAHGLADDFLTTVVLAARAPILLCPAMNTVMWQNPAVQNNLQTLINRGYQIIRPVYGKLACGDKGIGRLEDPKIIVKAVVDRLVIKDQLKGKKILITAGPTREPIDAVRFITNSSSGKMGKALALSASQRGAEVKLLLGQRDFVTGQDLLRLVKKYTPEYDVIFHTAAVGDFSPERSRRGKLSSKRSLILRLETQIKILSQIKKFNPKIFVVGFKAGFGLPQRLTIQSGADWTIYNDISRRDIGFGSDNNEVVMVLPDEQIKIRKALKAVVAGKILDFLARYCHW